MEWKNDISCCRVANSARRGHTSVPMEECNVLRGISQSTFFFFCDGSSTVCPRSLRSTSSVSSFSSISCSVLPLVIPPSTPDATEPFETRRRVPGLRFGLSLVGVNGILGDGERVSERRLEGMEESLEWARARVKASFAGRVIVTRGLSGMLCRQSRQSVSYLCFILFFSVLT